MHVRAVDGDAQRTTLFVDDQAAFGAVFSTVGGVSPNFVPPKRALAMAPSALCQSQWTPPSSSHSAIKAAMILAMMPFLFQRWNQSCTVLLGPKRFGNFSHWQLVRMRKMMPLSARRQFASLRPVAFFGQNSSRIGRIRSHSSSEISQIVPSGLATRRFLRFLAILDLPGKTRESVT